MARFLIIINLQYSIMKNLYLSLIFTTFVALIFAQTNISGIVNNYAPLSAFTSNTVSFGSQSGTAHNYSCGDRIMIIQMKGASITTANNSSFGNISSIGNAGNYEMATIESVTGSVLTLTENLTKTYTVADKVQVIWVPHYEEAIVTATLTALAWNGTVGGVLAIEVDGTLTLNAAIDVSELGFRGGNRHAAGSPFPNKVVCYSFWGLNSYNNNVGDNFRYDNANKRYANEKGESITTHSTYLWGKGKFATGGGGGGVESGGAGGGANYGTGGNGGKGNPLSTDWPCTMPDVAGKGGVDVSTHIDNYRAYLGGGSGSGSNGNTNGYYNYPSAEGRNGGGIIYINANTIVGNNHSILANGQDGSPHTAADDFGGGGGGAGGSIILDNNIFTTNLIVEAKGGFGSSVSTTSTNSRRRGAGGGGGGGAIVHSRGSLPVNVSTDVSGGAKGLSYYNTNTNDPSHDGVNGVIGAVIYNYVTNGTLYKANSLVTTTTTDNQTVKDMSTVTFSKNGILATIKSNGNDLGNVAITTTVGNNGPWSPSTACTADEYYLPRYFDITVANQPTTTVDVSIYITATELADFITFTNAQTTNYKTCWGAVNSINDLQITAIHPSAANEVINFTSSYIACDAIYKLDFQTDKFSTFYLHSKGGTTGNLLPVELLTFEVNKLDNNTNELIWKTATEINNKGFFVQRSFNGKTFEDINWIDGNGNSTKINDYFLVDNYSNKTNNEYTYYRLKQLDFDGEFQYSKIISVKNDVFNKEFIKVFPNPAKEFVTIKTGSQNELEIELINFSGKIVKQAIVNSNEQISLSEFPSGIYYLKVYSSQESKVVKLVIR